MGERVWSNQVGLALSAQLYLLRAIWLAVQFNSFLCAVIQSGSMGVTTAVKVSAKDFGFALKEKQIEAVFSFVGGHDIFVSLPTGFGKSIYVMPFCQVYLIG